MKIFGNLNNVINNYEYKTVDDLILPKTPIIKIPSDETASYHGQTSTDLLCGRNTINVHKK